MINHKHNNFFNAQSHPKKLKSKHIQYLTIIPHNNTYINMFIVKVKTLKKEEFTIEFPDDNATVLDLKVSLCKQMDATGKEKNCDPSMCKIVYSGAVLNDDNKKLTDYKITSGFSVVLLIQRSTKLVVEEKKEMVEEKREVIVENAPVDNNNDDADEDEDDEDDEARNEDENDDNYDDNNNNYNDYEGAIELNLDDLERIGTPEGFMALLMNHPVIGQYARENPNGFLQTMANPQFVMGGPDNGGQLLRPNMPQLTDEEKNDVNDILDMTMSSYNDVIQYYMACDKDKEATINMLLNERF